MSNVTLRDRAHGFFQGTILAGGTLTNELDFNGYTKLGVIYSGATNGTLTAQVSHKADADGGTYVDLLGSNGVAVTFCGPTGTSGALSGTVLEPLAPYRYVKFKMSIAQATGVQLFLPIKA
jgi:hypothetical protein